MSHNVVEFYQRENWRMTSRFGWRRCPMSTCQGSPWSGCPVCKGSGQNHHNGIDFGDKPFGYPILTPDNGVVTAVGTQWSGGKIVGAGHYLGIRPDSGPAPVIMNFFHLQRQLVIVGQRVKKGQQVALNGSSGNSTGAHLHFELRKGSTGLGSGVWGDPTNFRLASPVPVAPSDKFKPGDWVTNTDRLNLRSAPGLGSIILATMEPGAVGQVLADADNGKHVSGYHWWRVMMTAAGGGMMSSGWMAEGYLSKTEPPKEPEVELMPPDEPPAPEPPKPSPSPARPPGRRGGGGGQYLR